MMSGLRQALRSPSSPFLPSSPLAQLFSSSASLPSPGSLFASCHVDEPMSRASGAITTVQIDAWTACNDPVDRPAHIQPLVEQTDPSACRKKAIRGSSIAERERKTTVLKKTRKTADDDVGLQSKYFSQQTKGGKSSLAEEAAFGGKPPSKTPSPLRLSTPPPCPDWRPVKDMVKTIDLCSSPPEAITPFSEHLQRLKCSRESSSADTGKIELLQLAVTSKRSIEMVELPKARRVPARRCRKSRKKNPGKPSDGSIIEYFPASSKPAAQKLKSIVPPKKKRKSDEGVPTLLSPITAQARFTEQKFVFGTSSQLENDCLGISKYEGRVDKEITTIAGKSLQKLKTATYERKTIGTGLWDHGKKLDQGLLECSDSYDGDESNMGITGSAQSTPIADALERSMDAQSATGEVPVLASEETGLCLSLGSAQSESKKVSSTSNLDPAGRAPISESTLQKSKLFEMPAYSTFTTSQLQQHISEYGIKKMTTRMAMIKRLEACWRALNLPAQSESAPQYDAQFTQPHRKRSRAASRAKGVAPEPIDPYLITRAIRLAAETPDAAYSFYHHILMYDPIILEDLTEWLNKKGLRMAGSEEGATVNISDVKLWCDANSVCALLRETQKGLERKRF